MLKLTGRDILKAYSKIKKFAWTALDKHQIEKCLQYVELAAQVAYSYNQFYADEELEDILDKASQEIIPEEKEYVPLKENYVFYDYAGQDHRGLTQQYLRALMAMKVNVLYILENHTSELNKEIFAELAAYPKACVYIVNKSLSVSEQIVQIYLKIIEFRPSVALMHLFPWNVVAIAVFDRIKSVMRYQINLTDHAFWLGGRCSDFVLEFRDYGATVSFEKRCFPMQKLLKLPYYPIANCGDFQGLPLDYQDDEKVIIFTGGSLFKTLGDHHAFYKMVKDILSNNLNTILLIAGDGSGVKFIRKFILDNHFENRIFLLGNRSDINHLFHICDIYLSTYPLCGGLMTQYAALNGKPILAYTDPSILSNRIEDILYKVPEDIVITYTNKELFYAEADRLIRDKSYRKESGMRLRNCVIRPDEFAKRLAMLVENHENQDIVWLQNIHYERFASLNLEIENEFSAFCRKSILKVFKFRSLLFFPKQVFSYAFSGFIWVDLKKFF